MKYQVQLQHQLYVLDGPERGHLVGWDGFGTPMIRTIPRNDNFIEAMMGRLSTFWNDHVLADVPPLDGLDRYATAKALQLLFPEDDGSIFVFPESARPWVEVLAQCKDDAKRLDAVIAEAENRLKYAMGLATFGVLPAVDNDGKPTVFTWKHQTRDAYEVPAASFRVFRKGRMNKEVQAALDAAQQSNLDYPQHLLEALNDVNGRSNEERNQAAAESKPEGGRPSEGVGELSPQPQSADLCGASPSH